MAFSIEAPLTFFQEPVEVVGFDAVESAQVAFGLVPEVLDSIDVVFLVGEPFRMVNPQVLELRDIKDVVGTEGIGIHNTVGRHTLLNDRQQVTEYKEDCDFLFPSIRANGQVPVWPALFFRRSFDLRRSVRGFVGRQSVGIRSGIRWEQT